MIFLERKSCSFRPIGNHMLVMDITVTIVKYSLTGNRNYPLQKETTLDSMSSGWWIITPCTAPLSRLRSIGLILDSKSQTLTRPLADQFQLEIAIEKRLNKTVGNHEVESKRFCPD